MIEEAKGELLIGSRLWENVGGRGQGGQDAGADFGSGIGGGGGAGACGVQNVLDKRQERQPDGIGAGARRLQWAERFAGAYLVGRALRNAELRADDGRYRRPEREGLVA